MKAWELVAKSVGDIAPLLGVALKGSAAKTVGSLIANTLGVKDDPDSILAAIKDPEVAAKLKNIQTEHKVRLEELALQEMELEVSDRKNARENNKYSKMPSIIVILLTAIVAVGGYCLFVIPIPSENEASLYLLLGTIIAKWGDSIAYWVGTTRSSQEKTRRLS